VKIISEPLEMLKSVFFAANVVWNLSIRRIYALFWILSSASGGFPARPHRGAASGPCWGTSVLQTPHCPPRKKSCGRPCSEPSAVRYMVFKVMRSNIEIAITPPPIDRLRSNLVQSYITGDTLQLFKVIGLRSRSRGQRSRSQNAINTEFSFSDFKLGMAS